MGVYPSVLGPVNRIGLCVAVFLVPLARAYSKTVETASFRSIDLGRAARCDRLVDGKEWFD